MTLPINTIRTGSDIFSMNKSGLIYTNTPLDCTSLTQVDGITATGSQPAGTDRRVAFNVDGTWYKLSGSGAVTLSALATQTLTADSVLAEGNTVAELTAATSISGFVGKSVGVAIALFAPGDATEFPTLSLEIAGKSNTDQTTKSVTSSEIALASTAVEVIDLSALVTATDGAAATVTVSLQQDGSWSAYMPLATARRQTATGIKFKADYSVASIGTGSAKVDRATALYRSNNSAVSGEEADIVSITEDFGGVGMRFGSITVKHRALRDADISAVMSMRPVPSSRERIQIGVGTGLRLTLDLKPSGAAAVDPNINHNTIRIWHGSQEVFDFDFNTQLSQASTTPLEGVTVFASYQYGWEPETWVEMVKGTTQTHDDPGTQSTKFTYALGAAESSKGVAAVKVILSKPGGTVTAAALGTANGKTQMFVLPHAAKPATIVVAASTGTPSWSYDEDSRILTAAGTDGAALTISYDWIAETPVCYGFVAAWNE